MDNHKGSSNFEDMCRACMSSNNNLTNIFDTYIEAVPLTYLLEQYIKINVNKNDQLPHNICKECICLIVQIYVFIKTCQSSEEKLKSIFEGTKNKRLILKFEEEDDDEVKQPIELQEIDDEIYIKEEDDNKNQCIDTEVNEIIFSKDNNQDKKIDETNDNVNKKLRPVRAEEQGPPYICNVCTKSFEHLSDIKVHRKREKHKRKHEYLCSICNDGKMYRYQGCVIHLRLHTNERPYNCSYCSQTFRTSYNRNRHLRTHTGERPHICETCGRGFAVMFSLKNHICIDKNKIFKCKHCSMICTEYKSYSQHMKTHKMDDSAKEFECDQCKKRYDKKCLLARHKLVHLEQRYLCNNCGRKFHHKGSLNDHIKVHLKEKPHKCVVCSKSFTYSSSLIKHLRVHSGERPFECKICNKRFRQPSHLRTHEKGHIGEKKFECLHCGKCFLLKGSLTIHMRIHTGETPYICKICNKGFYDLSSKKRHEKSHDEN